MNNQPKTIMLTYQGKTQALSLWAEELGVSRTTLKTRYQRGWSDEEILATPVDTTRTGKRVKRNK